MGRIADLCGEWRRRRTRGRRAGPAPRGLGQAARRLVRRGHRGRPRLRQGLAPAVGAGRGGRQPERASRRAARHVGRGEGLGGRGRGPRLDPDRRDPAARPSPRPARGDPRALPRPEGPGPPRLRRAAAPPDGPGHRGRHAARLGEAGRSEPEGESGGEGLRAARGSARGGRSRRRPRRAAASGWPSRTPRAGRRSHSAALGSAISRPRKRSRAPHRTSVGTPTRSRGSRPPRRAQGGAVPVHHRGERPRLRPGLAVDREVLVGAGAPAAARAPRGRGSRSRPGPGSARAGPGSWKKKTYQLRGICRGLESRCRRITAGWGTLRIAEARDPLGVREGEPPGDDGAPVVAHDRRRARAPAASSRPDHVGRQRLDAVGGDALRLVARVVAALVGHDHAEAGLGQGADLLAPAVPELGEAVQQDDRRPARRPGLDDVQADSVRLDEPLDRAGGKARELGTRNLPATSSVLCLECPRCACRDGRPRPARRHGRGRRRAGADPDRPPRGRRDPPRRRPRPTPAGRARPSSTSSGRPSPATTSPPRRRRPPG